MYCTRFSLNRLHNYVYLVCCFKSLKWELRVVDVVEVKSRYMLNIYKVLGSNSSNTHKHGSWLDHSCICEEPHPQYLSSFGSFLPWPCLWLNLSSGLVASITQVESYGCQHSLLVYWYYSQRNFLQETPRQELRTAWHTHLGAMKRGSGYPVRVLQNIDTSAASEEPPSIQRWRKTMWSYVTWLRGRLLFGNGSLTVHSTQWFTVSLNDFLIKTSPGR